MCKCVVHSLIMCMELVCRVALFVYRNDRSFRLANAGLATCNLIDRSEYFLGLSPCHLMAIGPQATEIRKRAV